MRLHDTDTNAENSVIFPKRICQTCVDLFRGGVEVIVKNNMEQRNISLFDLVSRERIAQNLATVPTSVICACGQFLYFPATTRVK